MQTINAIIDAVEKAVERRPERSRPAHVTTP